MPAESAKTLGHECVRVTSDRRSVSTRTSQGRGKGDDVQRTPSSAYMRIEASELPSWCALFRAARVVRR
jgi:hypothetical protein